MCRGNLAPFPLISRGQKKYEAQDSRQTFSATYSRNLTHKSVIFATLRNIKEEKKSRSEIFFGITLYPWKDSTFSARYEQVRGAKTFSLQALQNPPIGEGIGYRATFERVESGNKAATTINPFLQYNSRYGIYTGEFRSRYSKTEKRADSYFLSASGGIAYVGKAIGFSKPISDSFGLVEVAGLEGVRVYHNYQEIGRTDSSGRVFIPNLNSYHENHISINDNDIPIEYSISEIVKYVSPPLRSGSHIKFGATRIQAITGMLNFKADEKVAPVEFHEVRMAVEDREITFHTGKDGRFYLENIKHGKYKASFNYMGKECSFDIIIPETDALIIDLGGIICGKEY